MNSMEKITFKYISTNGKLKRKAIWVDMPEFKDYSKHSNVFSFNFIVSKESQVIDFLDSMDKTKLMIDNDFALILDYQVFYVKKEEKIKELDSIFAELHNANLLEDFMKCGELLKNSIKKLSIKRKIKIILKTMDISAIAYNAGSRNILDILDNKTKYLA